MIEHPPYDAMIVYDEIGRSIGIRGSRGIPGLYDFSLSSTFPPAQKSIRLKFKFWLGQVAGTLSAYLLRP